MPMYRNMLARSMVRDKLNANEQLASLHQKMLMIEMMIEEITFSDIKTITACYKAEFDCGDWEKTRALADRIIESIPKKTLDPLLNDLRRFVNSGRDIEKNVKQKLIALIKKAE